MCFSRKIKVFFERKTPNKIIAYTKLIDFNQMSSVFECDVICFWPLFSDQRNLGMSMRVERSTVDQVKARFNANKKKLEEKKKDYDLEQRVAELREEVTILSSFFCFTKWLRGSPLMTSLAEWIKNKCGD